MSNEPISIHTVEYPRLKNSHLYLLEGGSYYKKHFCCICETEIKCIGIVDPLRIWWTDYCDCRQFHFNRRYFCSEECEKKFVKENPFWNVLRTRESTNKDGVVLHSLTPLTKDEEKEELARQKGVK